METRNENVEEVEENRKTQIEIEMDTTKFLVVALHEVADRLVKALHPVTRGGVIGANAENKEGKSLVPLANNMHINNDKLKSVCTLIENTLEALEL